MRSTAGAGGMDHDGSTTTPAGRERCTVELCACGGYSALSDGDAECNCGCPSCDRPLFIPAPVVTPVTP
jgi:hypothetical protein